MALPPDRSPGPSPPPPLLLGARKSREDFLQTMRANLNLPGFLLTALLFAFAAPLALAEELAPDALIRRVSEEIQQAMRDDKALRAGDPARTASLMEEKILPHFDFRRATQIAMGANWRRATPEQQEALTREFRTLLVRAYTGGLASYGDRQILVSPLRAKPEDTEVTVRSHVKQAGTEPITVEYDLYKSGGAWKVFDVRIGGISLVLTYRTAFAEEVRNHGIEGLLNTLAGKNRQGSAKRREV
jgi:phospholipid transport system substrate-binding protein